MVEEVVQEGIYLSQGLLFSHQLASHPLGESEHGRIAETVPRHFNDTLHVPVVDPVALKHRAVFHVPTPTLTCHVRLHVPVAGREAGGGGRGREGSDAQARRLAEELRPARDRGEDGPRRHAGGADMHPEVLLVHWLGQLPSVGKPSAHETRIGLFRVYRSSWETTLPFAKISTLTVHVVGVHNGMLDWPHSVPFVTSSQTRMPMLSHIAFAVSKRTFSSGYEHTLFDSSAPSEQLSSAYGTPCSQQVNRQNLFASHQSETAGQPMLIAQGSV
ncbi:unnamed protein product [Prorocentrum cordatum]|uniref:Uncharacterized protein n=1 Tax=Prorocentrum cordatum TaxID=2364126 RepID=A0ABN9S801_9DINO|nr:unnamed protein product [Polarella glacialis]